MHPLLVYIYTNLSPPQHETILSTLRNYPFYTKKLYFLQYEPATVMDLTIEGPQFLRQRLQAGAAAGGVTYCEAWER